MVSKAGKAVRMVDRLNSKLRKKVTERSVHQICVGNSMRDLGYDGKGALVKMGKSRKDQHDDFREVSKKCSPKYKGGARATAAKR